MLVYLAAPYSKAENKEELMQELMQLISDANTQDCEGGECQEWHIVSPLFNHFVLKQVPDTEMGADYPFWKEYSRDLLRRCDRLIVYRYPGYAVSTGVADEINLAMELRIPIDYIDRHYKFSRD
jgi:hypothetical protein